MEMQTPKKIDRKHFREMAKKVCIAYERMRKYNNDAVEEKGRLKEAIDADVAAYESATHFEEELDAFESEVIGPFSDSVPANPASPAPSEKSADDEGVAAVPSKDEEGEAAAPLTTAA
jgi:recombinational DNA repair protein RecT